MTLIVREISGLITLFENSHDDIQRIDMALCVYYNKMESVYLNPNGDGKFNTFCRNNGILNDPLLITQLSKPPHECILVLFDKHFPFAYDMDLNERNHRIYQILRSFHQFGASFVDRFITKRTPITLYLNGNRERLVYGYIMQNSHMYIPHDILRYIFRFCDNSVIWQIADNEMQVFLHSVYKDTIYGPQFEVIDGMRFQITCCPMGWNVEQQVQIYLELKQFPHYIEDIMISFLIFTKETEYEYQKTVTYNATGRRKAHGISQHAMTFNDVKEGKFDMLHIGCCIEIIHIRYTNPYQYRNFITKMPNMHDTNLIWNVEQNELNKMKAKKSVSIKKTFDDCNCNCWILQFALHHNALWFYVKLLRLPFNTKAIQMKCNGSILYCDRHQGEHHKLKLNTDGKASWLALNMDTERYKKGGKIGFKPLQLASIASLSFHVQILITDGRNHNEICKTGCVTHIS